MNKVILVGRLTRNPEVRYSQGPTPTAIARYTLAVDRRFKREGEQTADFISCVVFGRSAEFAEKYFQQGTKIAVSGRIQTGSYTNKEGQRVYTTDVIVESQEFAERKQTGQPYQGYGAPAPAPAYTAQTPAYTAPAQGYTAPAPAQGYTAPAPAYTAPTPAQDYAQGPDYTTPAPAQGYGAPAPAPGYAAPAVDTGFMAIPDGLEEELPFN